MEDKIKIYRFFFNLIIQAGLVICSQIAFFWILHYLLYNETSTERTIVLGILDAILQGTVFIVYKYFFNTK